MPDAALVQREELLRMLPLAGEHARVAAILMADVEEYKAQLARPHLVLSASDPDPRAEIQNALAQSHGVLQARLAKLFRVTDRMKALVGWKE